VGERRSLASHYTLTAAFAPDSKHPRAATVCADTADPTPCTHLQNWAVLEVVSAWPTLQSAEGDAGASQRRDVAEVIATDRLSLVVAMNQRSDGQVVCFLTGRRVELPWLPVGSLRRPLVDGKTLRSTRVKL